MCDCGGTRVVLTSALISGKVKNCGIKVHGVEARRKDHTGEVFGRLVVDRMVYDDVHKKNRCHCVCDCGRDTIQDYGNLISGRVNSCGCLEVESRYDRKHTKLSEGMVFGKLKVLRDTGTRGKNGSAVWECQCDCGRIVLCETSDLTTRDKTSCGCDAPLHTQPAYKDLTGIRFGHLTVVREAYTRDGCVWWHCKCDCGNETTQKTAALTTGNTTSCGCSRNSIMVDFIAHKLDELSIDFVVEHRFDDCKYKRSLPFDFYLPEKNAVIEYDGAQHYKSIQYYGGDDYLKLVQLRDKIKDDYCESAGIKMIRIPYTKTKSEIESILYEL